MAQDFLHARQGALMSLGLFSYTSSDSVVVYGENGKEKENYYSIRESDNYTGIILGLCNVI